MDHLHHLLPVGRMAAAMIALLAVLASMHGCPSLAVPADPVPVVGTYTRCDPARLGWAAEGTLWWEVQQGVDIPHLAGEDVKTHRRMTWSFHYRTRYVQR
jgi:hypothetical protein